MQTARPPGTRFTVEMAGTTGGYVQHLSDALYHELIPTKLSLSTSGGDGRRLNLSNSETETSYAY